MKDFDKILKGLLDEAGKNVDSGAVKEDFLKQIEEVSKIVEKGLGGQGINPIETLFKGIFDTTSEDTNCGNESCFCDGSCERKETVNPFGDIFNGKGLADLFGGLKPSFDFNTTSTSEIFGASNVEETDTNYVITIALPGINNSDISVSVEDETLKVTATVEASVEEATEEVKTVRKEYQKATINREFKLVKADVKKIKPVYKNGELTIIVPKVEVKPVYFDVK